MGKKHCEQISCEQKHPSAPPPLRSVCIFCPTGRTFTFKNCSIDCDNETVLVIGYVAMSDGAYKRVTVIKSNIIGWAVHS